jgi:glutaconate CoA-transferase subunit B
VITDLGVLEPDPVTKELVLTRVHQGVRVADVQTATGWELRVATTIDETPPPTEEELRVLRELEAARPSGIG